MIKSSNKETVSIKVMDKIAIFCILLLLIVSSIVLIIFEIYLITYGIIEFIPSLGFEMDTLLAFLGSLIGGILTFIGVLITINYYKRKDIKQSFPRKQFLFYVISSEMSKLISEVSANINTPTKVEEVIDVFIKENKVSYFDKSFELNEGISMDCYNFCSVLYLIRSEIGKNNVSQQFYNIQINNLKKYKKQVEEKFSDLKEDFSKITSYL